jgi:hypothetical protein
MASAKRKSKDTAEPARSLRGWKEITKFLGQPLAVAQRWAKAGMPVERQGRYVVASPEQLSRWLGRESGTTSPVHIATDNADLSPDLKRAVSEARRRRELHRVK